MENSKLDIKIAIRPETLARLESIMTSGDTYDGAIQRLFELVEKSHTSEAVG